jgi:hypothetical protein
MHRAALQVLREAGFYMLTQASLLSLAARFDVLSNLRKGDKLYGTGDEPESVFIVANAKGGVELIANAAQARVDDTSSSSPLQSRLGDYFAGHPFKSGSNRTTSGSGKHTAFTSASGDGDGSGDIGGGFVGSSGGCGGVDVNQGQLVALSRVNELARTNTGPLDRISRTETAVCACDSDGACVCATRKAILTDAVVRVNTLEAKTAKFQSQHNRRPSRE